uniref:NFE2 like bZIP transcription factor 3 n=2 Tax=Latimeria chalumnae TaxID=7897 RepID=H3AZZ2_LATCH
SSSNYNLNISRSISHDICLHDVTLPKSDQPSKRNVSEVGNSEINHSRLKLDATNSSCLNLSLSRTNSTEILNPSVERGSTDVTNQDDLSVLLDDAVLDEINLMVLAMEESFDALKASEFFEESDSGLSLNSSNSSESPNSSSYEEGAVGYSSDAESVSCDGLEGAVGGYQPEHSELSSVNCHNACRYHSFVLECIYQNHTYNLPPNQMTFGSKYHYSGSQKLKNRYTTSASVNLSCDERRARALRIPHSVHEIVSMSIDSFNELFSNNDLTEAQISLIRDIRHRGKNKVAAQNCRKRKLDVIVNLEDDVQQLKMQREKLLKEKAQYNKSVNLIKQKLNVLYRDVFSRLRDDHGQPVNPNQYALRCNSDGSMLIVPLRMVKSEQKQKSQKKKK